MSKLEHARNWVAGLTLGFILSEIVPLDINAGMLLFIAVSLIFILFLYFLGSHKISEKSIEQQ